jgi:hypothetical protein
MNFTIYIGKIRKAGVGHEPRVPDTIKGFELTPTPSLKKRRGLRG